MNNQSLNNWEEEFSLVWGISPEGSLKYLKREEVKSFIRQLLDNQREGIRKEIENLKDKVIGETDIVRFEYSGPYHDVLNLPSLKEINSQKASEETSEDTLEDTLGKA